MRRFSTDRSASEPMSARCAESVVESVLDWLGSLRRPVKTWFGGRAARGSPERPDPAYGDVILGNRLREALIGLNPRPPDRGRQHRRSGRAGEIACKAFATYVVVGGARRSRSSTHPHPRVNRLGNTQHQLWRSGPSLDYHSTAYSAQDLSRTP
jgi:hypothetical protein